jgi:hypothetical protein
MLRRMARFFIDRRLAQRLERAEGAACAGFAEVRQRIAAEVGAEWRDFDGTYAVYDGSVRTTRSTPPTCRRSRTSPCN